MNTRTLLCLCSLFAASLAVTPPASAQLLGPSPPHGLAAVPSGPGELTLSWNASSSLLGIVAYRVYHVQSNGSLIHFVDVPGDQLNVTEAGLGPGVTIAYAVAAVDPMGEGGASAPVAATTWDVPGAPEDVAVATGPGLVGEATVTWNAPANNGGAPVLSYRVYRDGELVATVDAATTAWTDGGLSPTRAYTYAVSAANVVGEGVQSAAACGMPSPWAPELGCQSLL